MRRSRSEVFPMLFLHKLQGRLRLLSARCIPKHLLWIIPMTIFITAGCTVGPDYQGVEPDIRENWNSEMINGLSTDSPAEKRLASWWKVFDDPVLTRLEKETVKGNLRLKTALSRLREARLRRGTARADLFPSVTGNIDAQKQRLSEATSGAAGGETREYYTGSFDAGWEIDIFGGLRRSVQAAQAQVEANRANFNDVLRSLMAEVALNYIEVRTYQRRLQIARSNIETQQKTYELNQSRLESGVIDELALQQSLRNLQQTRARLPQLKSGLTAAKNRLAVLLGDSPGQLPVSFEEEKKLPDIPRKIAVGIPAETMRRRPDIRRAERKLAAQTAKIGVATAELYPKFRLLGSIGLETLDGYEILDAQNQFWKIGPGVSWKIFRAGAIKLNIEIENEKQKQALLNYKKTVLQAQEELENILTSLAEEQNRCKHLRNAAAAAERTESLARERYNAGLVDFFNVLEAQRSLFEIQDQLTQSRGKIASLVARLYKSLGGGWEYASMLKDVPKMKVVP